MKPLGTTVDDLLLPFLISPKKLALLATEFSTIFSHLALHSDDQFLATPVSKLPDGTESGEYLAIDLGGTNLRVAFIRLGTSGISNGEKSEAMSNDRVEILEEKSWPIQHHLKLDQGELLFTWLGQRLGDVIASRFPHSEEMPSMVPLSITFSFPMMLLDASFGSDVPRQHEISKATLLPMGKGFVVPYNLDLATLVEAGYQKHVESVSRNQRPLPVLRIVAIANDSVAILMALSYTTKPLLHSRTVMGMIMGTGTNAAIPMSSYALKASKLPPGFQHSKANPVVNTEWSINGTREPLQKLDLTTHWDEILSKSATAPGYQPFEYMTAGAYLPELIRLVVLEYCVLKQEISGIGLPSFLSQQSAITGSQLSEIVSGSKDPKQVAADLNRLLELGKIDHWSWTEELASVLLETESAVLRRSAAMVAAAITGLLLSTGDLKQRHGSPDHNEQSSDQTLRLIVACSGGLICLYKGYKDQIQGFLDQLTEELVASTHEVRVVLEEAPKGSLIGAAVLAGIVESREEMAENRRRSD